MAQAKLSLSWDAHQKNMCSGLSLLQQRGEFVDMTLAADGHLVKVHQMVLALVSPYIKDLIASAPCPHPVIFLNNISYTTLCEMLEYIYTGEVLVPKESLSDLITAGRALHIKGLKDMQQPDLSVPEDKSFKDSNNFNEILLVDKLKESNKKKYEPSVPPLRLQCDDDDDKETDVAMDETGNSTDNGSIIEDVPKQDTKKTTDSPSIQFTVAPQGGLQVIYNRYIYSLRYVRKDRRRIWRCICYSASRCPAKLVTNAKNTVAKRTHNHTHPFHDRKILMKLREGTIFSECQEAENKAKVQKNERSQQCTSAREESE